MTDVPFPSPKRPKVLLQVRMWLCHWSPAITLTHKAAVTSKSSFLKLWCARLYMHIYADKTLEARETGVLRRDHNRQGKLGPSPHEALREWLQANKFVIVVVLSL